MNLLTNFKRKLGDSSALGIFMKTGDPAFVEIAGHAGMDFVILDMEHGPVCLEHMQNNVRAAVLAGVVPIIRIDGISEHAISKALDIGALGIQVPQVETAAQAREIVRCAKFFPAGGRGVCRFVRAADYSATHKADYFKNANETLVILQLEGQDGIANLDRILEVEQIDVLFIGPYDLSQSLGVPGDTTHPLVVEQMRKIIGKAVAKGVCVGTFTDTPETMRMWKNAGVNYISYSVDVGIFLEACNKIRADYDRI
jgi:4-hydroxy-2-oxoheptanedioate aldolase